MPRLTNALDVPGCATRLPGFDLRRGLPRFARRGFRSGIQLAELLDDR